MPVFVVLGITVVVVGGVFTVVAVGSLSVFGLMKAIKSAKTEWKATKYRLKNPVEWEYSSPDTTVTYPQLRRRYDAIAQQEYYVNSANNRAGYLMSRDGHLENM